jgi:hypothetical protein
MRYGRALLAGLGWAGALGVAALCVMVVLTGYLAFDDDPTGVRPRDDGAVRLPSVEEAEVPRVPLARPPARLAPGGGSAGADGTAARGDAPRPGATPRPRAPRGTPQAPAGGSPPQGDAAPPPAAVPPSSPPGSGGGDPAPSPAPPPSSPTLGDTSREAFRVVGGEVGRVSPPVGAVVEDTGDRVGDVVDALGPRG